MNNLLILFLVTLINNVAVAEPSDSPIACQNASSSHEPVITSIHSSVSNAEIDGWIDLGMIKLFPLGGHTYVCARLYGIEFGNSFLYKVFYGGSYYNVEKSKDPHFNAFVEIKFQTTERVYSGQNDASGYGIMVDRDVVKTKIYHLDVPQW